MTPLTYYPWITIDFIPYWILRFIMEQNPQGTSTHLLSPVLLIKIHVQHIKYPIYVWMDSKTSKLITNLPSFNHCIYIYILCIYIYCHTYVWCLRYNLLYMGGFAWTWAFGSLERGQKAMIQETDMIYIYTLWLFNVAMGNDP